jgi:hypothetical protein
MFIMPYHFNILILIFMHFIKCLNVIGTMVFFLITGIEIDFGVYFLPLLLYHQKFWAHQNAGKKRLPTKDIWVFQYCIH